MGRSTGSSSGVKEHAPHASRILSYVNEKLKSVDGEKTHYLAPEKDDGEMKSHAKRGSSDRDAHRPRERPNPRLISHEKAGWSNAIAF